MFSGTTTIDAAAVLAAARGARSSADAAEVEVLSQAVAWAELHTVSSADEAATWGDSPVPLAGEGAPLVSEFCVMEFAAALGMSTDAGRALIAHGLEISYRLPRTWARVQAGELVVWRARRVAEQTLGLSLDAAAYVDKHAAPFAHSLGPTAIERLIAQALAIFMPQTATEIADRAADARHVSIDHRQVSFAGTSRLTAELDLADALDLDQVVQHGAQQLADLGIDAPLDTRRAMALGALARGDQLLALEPQPPALEPAPPALEPAPPALEPRPPVVEPVETTPHHRDLNLFVHLNDTQVARVENAGGHLLTRDQIAEWAHIPSTQVIVRPVIDLNTHHETTSYEIPDRLREQSILINPTCVFPWCTRSSRACDLDHIEPFDTGGTTSTDNLAPLCRRHHRLKTFGGWTYTQIEPGTFLWRSPHGYNYLRDQTGTRDLTPRPVDTPGSIT